MRPHCFTCRSRGYTSTPDAARPTRCRSSKSGSTCASVLPTSSTTSIEGPGSDRFVDLGDRSRYRERPEGKTSHRKRGGRGDGSSTVSTGMCISTREATQGVGRSMERARAASRWDDRPGSKVRRTRTGRGLADATTRAGGSGRTSGANQSWTPCSAVGGDIRRIRRSGLEAIGAAHFEALDAAELPDDASETSGALLARVAAVRHHEARRTAVRPAEVRPAVGVADGPQCVDRAVQHSRRGDGIRRARRESCARRQVSAGAATDRASHPVTRTSGRSCSRSRNRTER